MFLCVVSFTSVVGTSKDPSREFSVVSVIMLINE